jgi:PKD repeat protein
MTDANGATPSLSGLIEGTYIVQLTVSDGIVADTDIVQITITERKSTSSKISKCRSKMLSLLWFLYMPKI